MNIISNPINALQLYLHIAFVTYDGWCEAKGNLRNRLSDSDENSFVKCKEKCYKNLECTAFSYETPTPSYYFNCILMKGGPYTSGSGRPNTKCYILDRGTFILFFRYLNIQNTGHSYTGH